MPEENEGAQQGLRVRRVQSAYRQVAEQLREQIVTGVLAPGVRLPNEGELGKLFGVSRSTVREALRLLASEKLIDTTRGVTGGSFVATPDASTVAEHLGGSLGLLVNAQNMTIPHLLEARLILEPSAARLAAERAGEHDLAKLRSTIESTSNLAPSRGFEIHWDFHTTLVASTANPLLDVMCQPINVVLRTQLHREGVPREVWDGVDQDHVGIFHAIEARDADRAEELTRQHLNSLRPLYLRMAGSAESGAEEAS